MHTSHTFASVSGFRRWFLSAKAVKSSTWVAYFAKESMRFLSRASVCISLMGSHAIVAAMPVHASELTPGASLERFSLLKAGTHRYLRYTLAQGHAAPVDLWTREVSFEQRDGQAVLRIRQQWDSGPGGTKKSIDSWFDAPSLRPRSHFRETEKNGKRTSEEFQFKAGKLIGMTPSVNGAREAAVPDFGEPAYNFEADIELLRTLPLAQGYEARIRFYHPGGPSPAGYTFRVTGSAVIAGPAGLVDCWVLTTDYNRPGTLSTMWFTKGSQLLVRQETPLGDRIYVKALIE